MSVDFEPKNSREIPGDRMIKFEITAFANLASITFLAIGILTGNPILLGIGITASTLTMGLNGYHVYSYIKNREEEVEKKPLIEG